MIARKQRTHSCGLSNIDYRTKGDVGNADRLTPSLKYSEFGTMNKIGFKHPLSKDLPSTDTWKTNGGWIAQRKHDPVKDESVRQYL